MLDSSERVGLLEFLSAHVNGYRVILGHGIEPSLVTPFGLEIKAHSDGLVSIQRTGNVETVTTTHSDNKTFQYRVFPDYQTSLVWYDSRWPQNPRGEYHVDQDVLEERYPTWFERYNAWVSRYEEEFKRGNMAHDDVFPNAQSQSVWDLEGVLLSSWLCLQQDVNAVSYSTVPGVNVLAAGTLNDVATVFLQVTWVGSWP
ncbi:hypothetical protein B0H67DRAFT_164397 [Lasiosphaeris hirsuta]|uniref:Uncharacterized protein n=1 Tax=Lasiosphaeris hirsuta TaxID=260670 RepID=A0AA40DY12_9PEZI|nr:hypothetical protein B0H67DRAFT_164397 [Lasiosphaeris hirsuta]